MSDPARPSVQIPEQVYLLPLRNAVLFPMMKMPISVGRPRSVGSILRVGEGGLIGIITQKDKAVDEPALGDLYDFGVLARIEKIQKMTDGTLTVLVHGLARIYIDGEGKFPTQGEGTEGESKGLIAKIFGVPTGLTETGGDLPIEIEALVKNI